MNPPIGFNLLFSQRQPVACNNDWLSSRTTCHAVLVANRNKRLVASYPGAFVLAHASLICFYCFTEVTMFL